MLLVLVAPGSASAGETEDTAALAKAAQNPIADMISLPFQNNTFFGVGPDEKTANVLNIQPVYPTSIGDWNIITRTYVPDLTAGRPELPSQDREKSKEPEKWVTTLRADLWTGFADGWKLYGRVDEPLVYSDDVTSSFNPNGQRRFGQGDLLTEVAIIAPPPSLRLGHGLGVRAVWPTAGLRKGTASTRSAPSPPPATACRRSAPAASS